MNDAIEAFWRNLPKPHAVNVRLVEHIEVDLNAPPPLRFPAAHRNAKGELEIVASLLAFGIWKRSWTHIMADALHYLYGSALPTVVRDALLAAQQHCPMRPRLMDEGVYRALVEEEHVETGVVQCWEPLDPSFPVDPHALQAFTFAPLVSDDERLWWPEHQDARAVPMLTRLEEDVIYWADKLNMVPAPAATKVSV